LASIGLHERHKPPFKRPFKNGLILSLQSNRSKVVIAFIKALNVGLRYQ